MDQILYVRGLLEIGEMRGEGERATGTGLSAHPVRSAGIGVELRGVGNDVVEIFVQESIVRFDPEFKLLPPVIDRYASLEISLAKPIVLKHFDGGRILVGVEVVGIIPPHAPKVRDDVGRECVLVGNNSHRLEVAGSLKLRTQRQRWVEGVNVGSFLDLLVR